MTYALIDDATGATLATAEDPHDFFDAEEAENDDELFMAIMKSYGEAQTPVGGGAAPLIWIVNRSKDA